MENDVDQTITRAKAQVSESFDKICNEVVSFIFQFNSRIRLVGVNFRIEGKKLQGVKSHDLKYKNRNSLGKKSNHCPAEIQKQFLSGSKRKTIIV